MAEYDGYLADGGVDGLRAARRGIEWAEEQAARAAVAKETKVSEQKADPVNHPPHYNAHPSGVECVTIAEHFNFNVGNAIKYIWRAGLKGDALEDLKKAEWYVSREIERVEREQKKQ